MSLFSALRRLAKPGEGKDPSAPSPMSSALQKRFSRGVHYNMKILIKGDRNVGKSCLLQRLQGGPFVEEYRPTDQIQLAPIHWSYKNSDHIVKVEVWEVVDKGKARKKSTLGLKLENQPSGAGGAEAFETPALDATFLDVYKNANGVILMMDITKPWTFDYVQRELGTIPADLPIIILGNHCDMHHHRQVHKHEIEQFIASAKQTRNGSIRYAESSMRNGFGLRLLHKFLNVPFLKLQRSTVLEQLNRNEHDTMAANEELDLFQNSEESDYTLFMDRLASKKSNGQAPATSNRVVHENSPSIVLGGGKLIIPPNVNPLIGSVQTEPTAIVVNNVTQPESPIKTPSPSGDADNPVVGARLSEDHSGIKISPKKAPKSGPIDALDDFCPGALDNTFLDDFSLGGQSAQRNDDNTKVVRPQTLDSDSDAENSSNPMVMVVQDDIESEEENSSRFRPIRSTQPKIKTRTDLSSRDSNVMQPLYAQNSEPPSPVDKLEPSGLKTWKPTPEEDRKYAEDSFWRFERSYANDSLVNEVLETDTSLRRSPEGGEDPDEESTEVKTERTMKEDKKHHKKSKKSKDKEKCRDKEEKSETGERKERRNKEKKHRKKNSDELLEQFLSGKTDDAAPVQEAYEAL